MIDTHAHMSKEYFTDYDQILKNAKNNNVNKIIISGCDKNSILEGIDIINHYDDIYMTIGFHPDQVEVFDIECIDFLREKIKLNKKIVGIGEIGLDYHYDDSNKEKQIEMFKIQLQLAEEFNLPVVIHSRDALLDTIECLKQFKIKGIIHCFSGSFETANIYINMGFKLGIGGVLTFKNSKLFQVIEKVDLENIVLETDCPYMSPEPYRGTTNEPKNIKYVCDKIAEIKNVSTTLVDKITTNNVMSLFDLK